MNSATLALSLLAPLGLAGLAMLPVTRRAALAAAPWAPLPALALALYGEDGQVEVPSLLLGALFGLDQTARTFLLFTALLWTIAGVYARRYLAGDPRRARFFVFFLATCAGNLGLLLARDIASFYFFFALMTFAAYGLVVHEGTAAARRAGRVYLVMAVLGEAALLIGFFLLFDASGTLDLPQAAATPALPAQTAMVALVLAGFGIKVGAPLLHMWLPLAHPVAPTPASAVLSGAIIKAGLYGWLRFLPLGGVALPEAGAFVIGAGLLGAFYGAAVGITQRDAKTVLAYSSISQMGIVTIGVGAALVAPASAPLIVAAVAFYALHHALAKGALFLGVGVARGARAANRAWVLAGLALPAAALAGAPLTSGALAKAYLKHGMQPLAETAAWVAPLLSFAAVGTVLLMARFLFVLVQETKRTRERHPGLAVPWLVSLATVGLAYGVLVPVPADVTAYSSGAGAMWDAVWPVLVGGAAGYAGWRARLRAPDVPSADVLVPIAWLLARAHGGWCRLRVGAAWSTPFPVPRSPPGRAIARLERRLRALPVVGGVLLLLLGLFAVLLALA